MSEPPQGTVNSDDSDVRSSCFYFLLWLATNIFIYVRFSFVRNQFVYCNDDLAGTYRFVTSFYRLEQGDDLLFTSFLEWIVGYFILASIVALVSCIPPILIGRIVCYSRIAIKKVRSR